MLHRAGVVAAGLTTLLLAVGCGGGSAKQATPTTPQHTFSLAPCPVPSVGREVRWPATVPADMPKPPHATITDTSTTTDGVHITKFTTPTSLRDGVLFIVEKFPKAGYVLGRGDAEVTEADAPFVHGSMHGVLRLLSTQPCSTLWLLATVASTSPGAGSPLLPSRSPSGSPSPLPFG